MLPNNQSVYILIEIPPSNDYEMSQANRIVRTAIHDVATETGIKLFDNIARVDGVPPYQVTADEYRAIRGIFSRWRHLAKEWRASPEGRAEMAKRAARAPRSTVSRDPEAPSGT